MPGVTVGAELSQSVRCSIARVPKPIETIFAPCSATATLLAFTLAALLSVAFVPDTDAMTVPLGTPVATTNLPTSALVNPVALVISVVPLRTASLNFRRSPSVVPYNKLRTVPPKLPGPPEPAVAARPAPTIRIESWSGVGGFELFGMTIWLVIWMIPAGMKIGPVACPLATALIAFWSAVVGVAPVRSTGPKSRMSTIFASGNGNRAPTHAFRLPHHSGWVAAVIHDVDHWLSHSMVLHTKCPAGPPLFRRQRPWKSVPYA